jgi:hypothetical protein
MRAAVLPFERRAAQAGGVDAGFPVSTSGAGFPAAVIDLQMIRRARVLKETLRRTLAIKRAHAPHNGTAA